MSTNDSHNEDDRMIERNMLVRKQYATHIAEQTRNALAKMTTLSTATIYGSQRQYTAYQKYRRVPLKARLI